MLRTSILVAVLSSASARLAPPLGRGAIGFDDTALSDAKYFDQVVDHFAPPGEKAPATFRQAYYTNDKHYMAGGPVLPSCHVAGGGRGGPVVWRSSGCV